MEEATGTEKVGEGSNVMRIQQRKYWGTWKKSYDSAAKREKWKRDKKRGKSKKKITKAPQ